MRRSGFNSPINSYSSTSTLQPQPLSVYAKAYGAAVTAAISISATLTYFIRRSGNLSPTKKLIIQRFVPLPATSLASTLNVLCMRAPEMETGIDVFDEQGNKVGTSKVAAKQAIIDTALTRAFLPIPLLLAPPCIMPFLEKLKFVQKSALRNLLVNACVCTISFGLSLPVALALFPQQSEVAFRRKLKVISRYRYPLINSKITSRRLHLLKFLFTIKVFNAWFSIIEINNINLWNFNC